MLERLQSADFTPFLGQHFYIHTEDHGVLESVMTEVSEVGKRPPEGFGRRQAFSVLFRGPKEPILPQRIYRVSHQIMGDLDLFLVPIGPDDVGMVYETIFN